MNDSTIAQFNELRLIIEREVPGHGTLVITSATANDGTSLAAFGIADSLAAASHKTLLIRASVERQMSKSPRSSSESPFVIGEHGMHAIDATDAAIVASSSRAAVDATLERLRSEYTYVIIDAGPLPGRPIVTMLSELAQATLIALRNGRSRCSQDRVLARSIDASHFRILGVVATGKAAIDAFANQYGQNHLSAKVPSVGNVTAVIS